MSTKQIKISKISRSIFALEAQYGHLNWKVTDLEKKSKVSRALIYRYLGSKKSEIFENAFQHFIIEFYGFYDSDDEEQFIKKIFEARAMMIKYKEAVIFYQKWRLSSSTLADKFKDVEAKFQKKLKSIFPHISEENIPLLHGFIHGMVTAPFLTPEQAIKGLKTLNQLGF